MGFEGRRVEVVGVPRLLRSIFSHGSLITEGEGEVSETELKKVLFVSMIKIIYL